MSERSILSRLVTSAAGQQDQGVVSASQQFPKGFQGGQLQGAYGTSFAQFRPQYSVPGQQVNIIGDYIMEGGREPWAANYTGTQSFIITVSYSWDQHLGTFIEF